MNLKAILGKKKKVIFPDDIIAAISNDEFLKPKTGPLAAKAIKEMIYSSNVLTNNEDIEEVWFKGEEIPAYACSECSNLQRVHIAKTICRIGECAFSNCISLSTVLFEEGSLLDVIENEAFAYTGMTDIQLPKNLREIRRGAFCGCQELTNVSISKSGSLEVIAASAFRNCSTLKDIPFEETSLKEIGCFAFFGCHQLRNAKFSATIQNIGKSAFFNSGIEYVDLSRTAITIIDSKTFMNNSIKNVLLPYIISEIGDSAFKGNNIASINIPAVCEIAHNSFDDSVVIKKI